jgi:hypothetical protein
MAASDYDFNVTRNQIIERAYRIIGAISVGDPLSGEMLNQALIALNSMIKSWQSRNVFLWTLKEFSQTLTAGDASYPLSSTDPAVYAIDRAYLRIDNDDRAVQVASFRQYQDIYNKTDTGDPVMLALDGQISPTMYVWPVPTQTRTIYYTGIVKLKDFDTAGGNPDFPVRYIEAITYGLAHKLSSEYGIPLAERRELERQAQIEFQEAKSGERERAECDFVEGAF